MSKSGGDNSKQTVTSNEPWSGQAPFLTNIYNAGQQAYNKTPKTPYGGEYIADPTKGQQQTNAQAYTTGTQAAQQGGNLANFGLQQLNTQWNKPQATAVGAAGQPLQGMRTEFLDPGSNKYLMPALQSNISLAAQQAREEMFPQIGANAWKQGAYGGTAHGTALARSARDVEQAAANQTANALSNAYNTAYTTERGIEAGQQAQLAQQNAALNAQMLQMAPQLINQGYGIQGAGLQQAGQAGQQAQGWNQDAINEGLQMYQAGQTAPWNGLQNFTNAVGGALGGTGTSTTSGPQASGFGNFMGGALGGGTLGYGAAAAMGMANPFLGALAGGLAGGLGGFL